MQAPVDRPRRDWKCLTRALLRVVVAGGGLAAAAGSGDSRAGGSHNGPAPGAPQSYRGAVQEWDVPRPAFPRDPAVAPDGSIFFVHMLGNRLTRFEPKSGAFTDWELPPGTRPHNVLVDGDGIAWITGQQAFAMLRLDPKTGAITSYKTQGDPHTSVLAPDGALWFTQAGRGWIGRLDRASGAVREIKVAGNPYGLTFDRRGRVWAALIQQDKLAIVEPKDGTVRELPLPAGSRPMRMAAAPDGRLWVTLHGTNRLLAIDPDTEKVVKDYALPGGPDAKAYAVTVDAAGTIWVNEILRDTVVRLDPATDRMETVQLGSAKLAIRKMVVDQQGTLWYVGTNNNRIGRVQ